jgi:hypothetical protein
VEVPFVNKLLKLKLKKALQKHISRRSLILESWRNSEWLDIVGV